MRSIVRGGIQPKAEGPPAGLGLAHLALEAVAPVDPPQPGVDPGQIVRPIHKVDLLLIGQAQRCESGVSCVFNCA
jgi:hypothetical protein